LPFDWLSGEQVTKDMMKRVTKVSASPPALNQIRVALAEVPIAYEAVVVDTNMTLNTNVKEVNSSNRLLKNKTWHT
jgi:hypothetical protein